MTVYIVRKYSLHVSHPLFSARECPATQLRYDLARVNGEPSYSSSGNNDVLSCLGALLLLMGLQPLRSYRSQPNYDL